jgi:16S rRNA (adenine1518-N6/adenine1519-N6)-dimethyltransferase
LVNPEVIEDILDYAQITKDDTVLEIGPGVGFVTEQLVKYAKKVIAVELDEEAIKELQKLECDNLELIHNDILKTDIAELCKGERIKVVANIPYYITSPILVHLLGEIDELVHKNRKRISEIILMVQLEVANRIVANENSQNKEYGQLSILSQMYSDVEIIKKVPKNCFSPSPKVDSALVKFTINDKPRVDITKLLKRTVKAIFMARRKNVKNSLLNAGFVNVEKALDNVGIDKMTRGEKLSLSQIQELSKALEEFN